MTHGDEVPAHHDLSSLRILGGTGEPWNPEPFHWYFKHIGGGRIPVINYTGGTEIAGGSLCGNVISRLRPCSFAGPVPGIAAAVLDAAGKSGGGGGGGDWRSRRAEGRGACVLRHSPAWQSAERAAGSGAPGPGGRRARQTLAAESRALRHRPAAHAQCQDPAPRGEVGLHRQG